MIAPGNTVPLLDNPPRKANGTIDHTGCPHDATPAGRKLCRDHVARMDAGGPQIERKASKPVGGTPDTRKRVRRVPRASEPIGRWYVCRGTYDVRVGEWVRVITPFSTGRYQWTGELLAWNETYCSVHATPGLTRHLRVDKDEVIRVEVFESDAPEWNGRRVGDVPPRYEVTGVSVGNAGLTERPAVWDRHEHRTVKIFRKPEKHLAEKLAARLNAEEMENTP